MQQRIYSLFIFFAFYFGALPYGYSQFIASEFNEVAFFDFNSKLKKSYDYALQMRFKEAKVIIQDEKVKGPMNLMPHYLDDFVDFFRVYVNENPKEYKRLLEKKDIHLNRLEDGDKSSPYYLYTQAEILIRWAMLQSKFEDYSAAIKDMKRAAEFLKENKEKFPNFIANRKAMGMLYIIAGSIPSELKWGAYFSGVKGNINDGMNEFKAVIRYGRKNPSFEYNKETQILYALLLLHANVQDEAVWKLLNVDELDFRSNPMACYVLANMSLHTGKSSKALAILQSCPRGDDYHPFYYLEYMKGLCRLYKLDSKSEYHFKKYIDKHPGVHHIKDAYQKMAWQNLLNNNISQYKYYMKQVASSGADIIFDDMIAQEEAESGATPNLILLKARLLSDGGYYDQALSQLKTCKTSLLKSSYEKLLYAYLNGVVYHKMKRYDDAAKHYESVIDQAKSKSARYEVCNAALQLGLIWHSRKDYSKAKEYYNMCLKYSPKHYKKALHDRARQQLKKIK